MEKKLITEIKSTGEQLLKIKDPNVPQIFEKGTRDAVEKHHLLNTSHDETFIVYKCTNSLANADSGYAETLSTISESSENIHIHSKGSCQNCKLSASPCSVRESWKSGIKKTSTPFTGPTFAFDKQNVCQIEKATVKTLEFENGLQGKNQDFDSKKTDEASENEKSCLRAPVEVGCENSDDGNIIKLQGEPGCSSKISKVRAHQNGGAIGKSRVLTSQGRRRSGQFVSMAEAMKKFHMQTPKRFRTMPNNAMKLISSNKYQVTERKSLKRRFPGSSNNNPHEPKIEVELQLKNKQNCLPAPDCSGAKKSIHSSTTSRWTERNKVLLAKRKKPAEGSGTPKASTFVFRAQPMPSFKPPKVIKSCKPLTVAQSPVWARTKNNRRKFQ